MPTAIARSPVFLWFLAIRPVTLSLSLAPVFVGSALVVATNKPLDLAILLVTLLAAGAIQIGTNLLNDAEDFERGNDGSDRRGPPRATARGWISAGAVRNAATLSFLIAGFAGLFLIKFGGWPIFWVGIASILAGIAYSAGPLPISHTPLGELFVFVFFGVLAVVGTFYLQAGFVSLQAIIAGMAMGGFAAAVLHINNTRDIEEDRRAGRRTLAIFFHDLIPRQQQKPTGSRLANAGLYALFLLIPFVLLSVSIHFLNTEQPVAPLWLPLLCLPNVVIAIRAFATAKTGSQYNRMLSMTIGLQLLFATLLCVGILL